VELYGKFDSDLVCPIAADATIRHALTGQVLVKFPIVIGQGVWRMGPSASFGAGSSYNQDRSSLLTAIFAVFNGSSIYDPTPIQLLDVTTKGNLDLVPSPLIALRTRRINRYWGKVLHFSNLELVISTD
jgi:hypothetical protein